METTTLTIDTVRNLMDKSYTLVYIDYTMNLNNSLEVIIKYIKEKSASPLYDHINDWLSDDFWKKVRKKGTVIKNVATDLSAAFISSVMENAPQATHVFDHFHVVKLMNEALDDIRRTQYNEEKDLNKRKVIKGTRYLLLRNGKDVFDSEYKTRLDNALAMNEPLSKAYYLKEGLREIWRQVTKEQAETVLMDWVKQAQGSKIKQLVKIANTMMAYRTGILAWYDCHISTGKVEGINNKIKVMKRVAYGFRDEEYFKLRLFALHDCRITRNVG